MNIILRNNFIIYINNNLVHNNYNKPSAINNNGSKSWRENNKWHREFDKPAHISNSGYKERRFTYFDIH